MNPQRIVIVSPAVAQANNGNWHTAARWAGFLAPVADVRLLQHWTGEPADVLIALHARKSADSIARYCEAGGGTCIVVLTGTDLYRDLPGDADAQRSLQLAHRIVVLQSKALARLPLDVRHKAGVIEQSAPHMDGRPPSGGAVRFVAVGHLRDEKDPSTLMRAAERLRDDAAIEIHHIGAALDEALAVRARATMRTCPHYRWVGGMPHDEVRAQIAGSHALVHPSRLEGGANAVIEAVRSGVPVIASDIDGNTGLLGDDHEGCFPVGDDVALAAMMSRFAREPAFAQRLRAQCQALAPRFAPEVEARALQALVGAPSQRTHHG